MPKTKVSRNVTLLDGLGCMIVSPDGAPMAVQPKSFVLFAATFIVAFALGLFVDARLIRGRRERRPPVDRRFTSMATLVDSAIKPRSDAQRDSVDIVVQRFTSDNTATMSTARRQTRAHTDSLRVVLAPMLDSAQRVRLDSVLASTQARDLGRPRPRDAAPPPPSR
jgi:hypothetical protein